VAWKRVIPLMTMASNAGHDLATYALATWHLHGVPGIKKRVATAIPLLERASRSCGLAMFDLAVSCELGKGVAKDPRRAFALYRKATRHGVITAWLEVARCHHFGIGTPVNLRKADAAVRKAEALGAVIDDDWNVTFPTTSSKVSARRRRTADSRDRP
jgi:TPR repeat protein